MKRTLDIDPDILVAMCKPTKYPHLYMVTKNPLPRDATLTGILVDPGRKLLRLQIESPKFTTNTPEPLPLVEFTEYRGLDDIRPVEEESEDD